MSRFLGASVLLLAFIFVAHPAGASFYGEGPFGECGYDDCADTPTTVVTEGSLEISVNVTDDQVIPRNGYVVIVKLLSDPSLPLKQVDFYVDDQLVASFEAEDPLMVRWLWHTDTLPGSRLKVVATDSAGNRVERQFTVRIADASTEVVEGPLENINNTLLNFVISLPRPVVYLLPYLLFLLLVAIGVVLLLQARREMAEYHTLRKLIERSKTTSEVKTTLIQLVSHYLRTPITLINGGIDMLAESGGGGNADVLRTLSNNMRLKAESLVAEVEQLHDVAPGVQPPARVHVWSPALILPVASIGILVASFNYFAARAGLLSGAEITVVIQVLVFCLIVGLLYVIFRRRQLRRRDARYLQAVVVEQEKIAAARDQVIARAVSELGSDQRRMEQLVGKIDQSDITKIVKDGLARFHAMLARFSIASRLKGGQSTTPLAGTSLQSLFDVARQSVEARAAKQSVTITLATDTVVPVRSPSLTAYVLASLLDNAIAYSPNNSAITVSARAEKGGVVVRVADQGKGMTPAQVSLLFQPFFKTEGAGVFNHEGMGFSLYLDKLIMVYLGGDIAVESRQGAGTTVSLYFDSPAAT